MFFSWSIYLITILVTFRISRYSQKTSVINHKGFEQDNISIYIIAMFIPIFISSIRYNVGVDYIAYTRIVEKYEHNSLIELFGTILDAEPGTTFMLLLSRIFIDDKFGFFLIASFLTIVPIFIGLWIRRKKIMLGYSVLMFMCMFYGGTFNVIKQYIAIGILFIGYKYIEENNLRKYIMYVICAMMFHYTAIIALPLYLINNRKYGKKIKLVLIIIIIIFIGMYEPIMQIITKIPIFSEYQMYTYNKPDFGIGLMITKLPLLLMLIVYYKKLLSYNPKNHIYIYMIFFSLILSYIGYISPFVNRLCWYFDIVQILLIPQIILISKGRNERFWVKLIIILSSLMYFVMQYGIIGFHGIFPYMSIFTA